MSNGYQEIIYSGAAVVSAVIGSVFDIRQRRIPNLLTGPCLFIGLFLHAFLGGWRELGSSLLAGLIAAAIFLVFYLAGGMGAGDVKLMAAIGCLVGFPAIQLVLVATAITGALFALVLAVRRDQVRRTMRNLLVILVHHSNNGLVPHPEVNLDSDQGLRLPFALPIATGCLFAMCAIAWEGYR